MQITVAVIVVIIAIRFKSKQIKEQVFPRIYIVFKTMSYRKGLGFLPDFQQYLPDRLVVKMK